MNTPVLGDALFAAELLASIDHDFKQVPGPKPKRRERRIGLSQNHVQRKLRREQLGPLRQGVELRSRAGNAGERNR